MIWDSASCTQQDGTGRETATFTIKVGRRYTAKISDICSFRKD